MKSREDSGERKKTPKERDQDFSLKIAKLELIKNLGGKTIKLGIWSVICIFGIFLPIYISAGKETKVGINYAFSLIQDAGIGDKIGWGLALIGWGIAGYLYWLWRSDRKRVKAESDKLETPGKES